MTMTKLFQERWRRANVTTIKYFKRLFNDHFLVFLVISFGGVVLGYRTLLTDSYAVRLWQSPWLAGGVALWLVIGLQFGQLVTYFKSADALFLMGSDRQIAADYLPRALALSFGYAVLWQIAAIGSVLPILWRMETMTICRLLLLCALILGYKWGMLVLARQALFLTAQARSFSENILRLRQLVGRLLLPWVVVLLVLTLPEALLIVVGLFFVLVLVAFGMRYRVTSIRAAHMAVNWPLAIAQATNHEQRVFRFYATFAEIPNQVKPIKRRQYLDSIIKRLTKQRAVMYRLYLIRFARDTDNLPLVLRLAGLGVVLVVALNQAPTWLVAVIAAAVIYLISFQLVPLYWDTQHKLWTRLMPLSPTVRQRGFMTFVQQILDFVSGALLVASLTHGWLSGLTTLVGVAGMRLFITQIYLPKQLK